MNKPLHISYWALIIVFAASVLFVANAAYQLWNANQLNQSIAEPNMTDEDDVPEQSLAQFALAYEFSVHDQPQKALDMYTLLLGTDDELLKAKAYYNRAIISLNQANQMEDGDPKQNPLIELAKQDFRHALELDPSLWDTRYNLEVALHLVPELPIADDIGEKNEISSSRSIEAVGFRVDLP